jgi:GntR family transcriptional regulator, transcriptional repressor for pyruvate dehydrogenase complex
VSEPSKSAPRSERAQPALGGSHRLRAQKTAELVATQLRNRIIRGELKAGDALPGETALMIHFSISRQTLREALRVLESESLLSIRRGVNGGPHVLPPDPELVSRHFGRVLQHQGTTLADVFEARKLIEPRAVRLLTERAAQRAPPVLRRIIDEELAVIDDHAAFAHATIRFHEALIELSGNQTLQLMLRTIDGVFEKHISLVTLTASRLGDTTRDKQLGLRAQRRLVQLIELGDAAGAEAFWQTNLDTMGKVILRQHSFERVVDVLD